MNDNLLQFELNLDRALSSRTFIKFDSIAGRATPVFMFVIFLWPLSFRAELIFQNSSQSTILPSGLGIMGLKVKPCASTLKGFLGSRFGCQQLWARYLEEGSISTKIGSGRDRDRDGHPDFLTN